MDIFLDHIVVLICSNLISATRHHLNPVEFDWNSVDSVLMPNECIVTLPDLYTTVTCGSKKKCTGRCQCSKFFFYKTITRLTNVQQTVTKIKKSKQYKNFSLLFGCNYEAYKHIQKVTII